MRGLSQWLTFSGINPALFPFAALIIPLFLSLLGGTSNASAQTERLELGKRLRRFELAWQEASPERRKAAVAKMEGAVAIV